MKAFLTIVTETRMEDDGEFAVTHVDNVVLVSPNNVLLHFAWLEDEDTTVVDVTHKVVMLALCPTIELPNDTP